MGTRKQKPFLKVEEQELTLTQAVEKVLNFDTQEVIDEIEKQLTPTNHKYFLDEMAEKLSEHGYIVIMPETQKESMKIESFLKIVYPNLNQQKFILS
jgi:hypothetical protein